MAGDAFDLPAPTPGVTETPATAPDEPAPSPAVDLADIAVAPARPASTGLVAARVEAFDEAARSARIALGGSAFEAKVDASVDAAVLHTAVRRGERAIVQEEAGAWVVLGVLRTAATPGVDEMDDLELRAKRIALVADHEVRLSTGQASVVLRARGYIESIANDITTRATSLHKIIGRMLRLN